MHLLDGSSTGRIDKTIRQLGRLEWQVIRAFESRDIHEEDAAAAVPLGHDHADVQDDVAADAQADAQADSRADAHTEAGTPDVRKED